jgi:peroxiredoxin
MTGSTSGAPHGELDLTGDGPTPGTVAPSFRAPASSGQTLATERFLGKVPVVLCFAPGSDDERGWEAVLGLDEVLADFAKARVQVLAVVPETSREVRDDADADDLTLRVLADPGGHLAQRFDIETTPGRVTSVVVDRHGVVVDTITSELGAAHALTLLDHVRHLQGTLGERMAPHIARTG